MTQLGRPFSEKYEHVIAALRERVLEGVEQPASPVRFTFEGPSGTYRLPEAPHAVTLVVGMFGGSLHEFVPDVDFRLSGDRIVWLDKGERPQHGSRFEVGYTYRESPSGLTDFTPGSVVGTLVHAVARQMKLIYDQMDEAYRRAFIDEAGGAALDNVVALLGVARNPALKATGEVTFYLRTEARASVVVPADTRVADESGHAFRTTAEGTIEAEDVDELVAEVEEGGVLRAKRRVARLSGVWAGASDDAPELKPESYTVFGDDERTITLEEHPPEAGGVLVRYKPKSVTVPVEAMEAGPEGNVNAGAIVVMPTPPRGIGGVLNEEPLGGGTVAEGDEQLRERAKHALETSGNATLNAIKYAVLDVDRVEGVEVIDHSVEGSVPLGEVRVRYSGGDKSEVEAVIEKTRAAGVLALVEEIVRVSISGTFYLIPEPEAPPAAAQSFLEAAREAMKGFTIGAPLSVARLNALAFGVSGLAGVAEAQLDHDREGAQDRAVPDPFPVARTELVRPDEANLRAALVTTLRVASINRAQNSSRIGLQLLDAAGNAVSWRGFSLGVSVTLLGYLKVSPESPPEHLVTLEPPPSVTWTGSDLATLTIPDAVIAGFDPEDRHLPGVKAVLAAAAYPSVAGAETTINPQGT